MIAVRPAEHEWASRADTGEAFNRTTIMPGGSGQYAGNIAEAVFARVLNRKGVDFRHVGKEQYSHDFEVYSATIDIKAKRRTVVARPDYSAHVAESQERHSCHYYVFASVYCPAGHAEGVEFMGWIPKREFWDQCSRVAPGDKIDGLVERAGAGRMPYRDLRPMGELIDNLTLYCYRVAFGEAI
jgi:hypothetical protein